MRRVIVIGCPGSGKSTFARALRDKTGLPLHHLDMMYWRTDGTTVPKEDFRSALAQVLDDERWIVDGNYASTMELRLQKCDTVFFLDYSTEVCLDGLNSRRGKPRPDLPWVEPEDRVDEEFLSFVKNYRANSRPAVVALLEKYREKKICVFQTREDADRYLEGMGDEAPAEI